MTAVYLGLLVGFMLPMGSIGRDIWRDEMKAATARDIARITAPLPPARDSLLPLDWPRRLTPSDLPARVALVVVEDGAGRHRAPDPVTTTGEFWAIVDNPANSWTCAHCATPEDGEPAHVGCPGCSCPCTLVEVVV